MEVASFKITPQAFQVIMSGLNELPHKVSRQVIDDLMRQAEELSNPAPVPTPAADAAPADDAAPAEILQSVDAE